jgi:2-oxoglutarate ferredoxin oxidoreductase subunit delta
MKQKQDALAVTNNTKQWKTNRLWTLHLRGQRPQQERNQMAKGRGILKFEIDKCKGCELCVHACPAKILAIDLTVVNKKDYHPVTCIDMASASPVAAAR